jgi:hypothetical protein
MCCFRQWLRDGNNESPRHSRPRNLSRCEMSLPPIDSEEGSSSSSSSTTRRSRRRSQRRSTSSDVVGVGEFPISGASSIAAAMGSSERPASRRASANLSSRTDASPSEHQPQSRRSGDLSRGNSTSSTTSTSTTGVTGRTPSNSLIGKTTAKSTTRRGETNGHTKTATVASLPILSIRSTDARTPASSNDSTNSSIAAPPRSPRNADAVPGECARSQIAVQGCGKRSTNRRVASSVERESKEGVLLSHCNATIAVGRTDHQRRQRGIAVRSCSLVASNSLSMQPKEPPPPPPPPPTAPTTLTKRKSNKPGTASAVADRRAAAVDDAHDDGGGSRAHAAHRRRRRRCAPVTLAGQDDVTSFGSMSDSSSTSSSTSSTSSSSSSSSSDAEDRAHREREALLARTADTATTSSSSTTSKRGRKPDTSEVVHRHRNSARSQLRRTSPLVPPSDTPQVSVSASAATRTSTAFTADASTSPSSSLAVESAVTPPSGEAIRALLAPGGSVRPHAHPIPRTDRTWEIVRARVRCREVTS